MSGASLRNLAAVWLYVLAAAGPAMALPYWIAWEGDDWPENQGWTRDIHGGGDVRTLADGMMTLDGSSIPNSWDAYKNSHGGTVDPDPGEVFVMQWRMRVNALVGDFYDPLVWVMSDESWMTALMFSQHRVQSESELFGQDFAPSVFHKYELRSADMRAYDLYLDGAHAWTGSFVHVVGSPEVGWGDGFYPDRSISSWDYFRVGVIPEPGGGVLGVAVGIVAARGRRG